MPTRSLASLPEGYRALVIGATGAIGCAFLAHLRADPRCALAVGLGRHTSPAVDLDDEATIAHAAQHLKAQGPWHCIIHAAGMLHGPQGLPEKRLGQMNYAQMEATFGTNTFGPALVLAHFAPLLPKQERGLLAVLSAKVGSIGDNRLGGWYSYRASKAALNMLLKTASIEVARTHPQAVLVALHPGTVDSALSAPFNGAEIGRPAADAAGDMLRVLDGLGADETGSFYAYSGEKLPW
ncbi:NAD(P)-dependent dehydrogenase (short-subunit alcohol dehydrogenase family) [Acidovorax sp. 69]|uniref:SDR family NAD(P)-dependent oxidoreductase n=1 Tax=Acidovorax sp. 69 TaxID=2035202 RepID=UPI000C24B014|nr:SDR family NAD(P)-dependent oxidoreductase [Acidovorax sp. 69]PJI98329.1 NAD(P)-dependent dehydrogenase (short-subunit alcohol dehydrogenase family) [Acidovorax sp. 69]